MHTPVALRLAGRLVRRVIPLAVAAAVTSWTAIGQEPRPSHAEQPYTLVLDGTPARASLVVESPWSGALSAWAEPLRPGLGLRLRAYGGATETAPLLDEASSNPDAPSPGVVALVEPGDARLLVVEALDPLDRPARVELHVLTSRESPATVAEAAATEERLRGVRTMLLLGEEDAARSRLDQLVASMLALDPDARSGRIDDAFRRIWRFRAEELAPAPLSASMLALLEHRVAFGRTFLPPDSFAALHRERLLAREQRGAGDLDASMRTFERALEVVGQRLGPGHARAFELRYELALTASLAGRLELVHALWERSLAAALARVPPDPRAVLDARIDLGRLLYEGGNVEEARLALSEALAAFEEAGVGEDSVHHQTALGLLADCHLRLQDPRTARRLFERFLASVDPTHFAPDVLERVRWNLACAMLWLGDAHLAREVFDEWRAAGEQRPLDRAVPLWLNLAQVQLRTGHAEEAAAQLRDLLDAALQRWGPRGELTLAVLSAYADAHLVTGRAAEAWPVVSDLLSADGAEALALTHPTSRELLTAAARLARSVGADARADTLAHDAFAAIPEDRRAVDPLVPEVLSVGLRTSAALRDEPATRLAFRALCARLRRDADLRAVSSTPREARSDSLRQEPSFEALLDVAVARPDLLGTDLEAQLFATVESARAAEFVAHRVQRRALRGGQADELREQVQSANRRLVAALRVPVSDAGAVTRLVRERDRLLARLQRGLGRESGLSRVDASTLAAALQADEVALVFREHASQASAGAAAELRTSAWVLRPGGLLVRVDLGPSAALRAALEAWREALACGRTARPASRARRAAAGTALRAAVLDPLRPHLAGARRAFVVPDGVVHELPLEALPEDAGGLVGDELRVRRLPTLAALLLEAERPVAADGAAELLVVGGIDYGTPSPADRAGAAFAPLRHSRAEVDVLWTLWNDAEGRHGGQLLTGVRATRERFVAEASSATHLHLATHGGFHPVTTETGADPELLLELAPMAACGLAFAHANVAQELGGPAGFLTAEELAQLDLERCRLAVLSACDTSRGPTLPGQGVASLQTALHAAGVHSAITSLWAVDDAATAELMTLFYARLSSGDDPEDALAAAKAELRRTQADERHWAGWVLSGVGTRAPDPRRER